MTEVARSSTHQFCETTLYALMDTHTGEYFRSLPNFAATTPDLNEAIDAVVKKGWGERIIIVKIDAIKPFRLELK